MTSFRQIEANRRNARKSTGPVTEEGKQRSRCNAVRHGLTAETVIGALEDAEDYDAFQAAILADYDAQSTVERELVLRLASLLWRLRRSTAIETGLFEIQAAQLNDFKQSRQLHSTTHGPLAAAPGELHSGTFDGSLSSHNIPHARETTRRSRPSIIGPGARPAPDLARCFLRLANLPSFLLDRLNRYEVTLWRQIGQILFALETLDRRKPQERSRRRLAQKSLAPGRNEF